MLTSPLWKRNLQQEYGPFRINFGYAASPLLYKDRLYIAILHRGRSFVVAIDVTTGKNVWARERRNDARAESQEAYTTPVPMAQNGKTRILILGGDRITAHDPETGVVDWQWSGYNPNKRANFRVVPSPVVEGNRIFINAPQFNPLYALELSDGHPEVAWRYDSPTTDVPIRWPSSRRSGTGRCFGTVATAARAKRFRSSWTSTVPWGQT